MHTTSPLMPTSILDSDATPTVAGNRSNQQPDAELLALYVEGGDRTALEPLVHRYSGLVYSIVCRVVYQSQDREDACQATFMTLVQSASKIRNHQSIASWLYSTAFRIALRIRQKSRNNIASASIEDMQMVEQQSPDLLSLIAQNMEFERLSVELQQLPKELRDPLIEHYFVGLSAPAIAERLEMSVSAVEGRLRRGKQKLRTALARKGIGLSVVLATATAFPKISSAAPSSLEELCLQAVRYGNLPSIEATGAPSTSGGTSGIDSTATSQFAQTCTVNARVLSLVQGELAMSTVGFTKVLYGLGLGTCCLAGFTAVSGWLREDLGLVRSGGSISLSAAYADEPENNFVELTVPEGQSGPGASGGGGSAGGRDEGSGGGAPVGGAPGAGQPPRGAPGGRPGFGGFSGGPGGAPPGYGGGGFGGVGGGGVGGVGGGFGGVPGMPGMGGVAADPTKASRDARVNAGLTLIAEHRNRLDDERMAVEGNVVPSELLFDRITQALGTKVVLGRGVENTNLESINLERVVGGRQTEYSLRTLLEYLLENPGSEPLGYVIHEDRIEIVPETQDNVLRFYQAGDLLGDGSNEDARRNLIELVSTFVLGDEDFQAGGTCRCSVGGTLLIVSCNERIHRKVEEFLTQISQSHMSLNEVVHPQPQTGGMGGMGGSMGGMGFGGAVGGSGGGAGFGGGGGN